MCVTGSVAPVSCAKAGALASAASANAWSRAARVGSGAGRDCPRGCRGQAPVSRRGARDIAPPTPENRPQVPCRSRVRGRSGTWGAPRAGADRDAENSFPNPGKLVPCRPPGHAFVSLITPRGLGTPIQGQHRGEGSGHRCKYEATMKILGALALLLLGASIGYGLSRFFPPAPSSTGDSTSRQPVVLERR